jgi:hypothetical protein
VSTWTERELESVGDAQELELASRRADGSLRSFTTMWVVRVGGDVYVRSAGGPDRPWYRQAEASGAGRVRVGNVEAEVQFAGAAPETQDEIDAQYHAKYDRYGPNIVGHVTGPASHPVTIHLIKCNRGGENDE